MIRKKDILSVSVFLLAMIFTGSNLSASDIQRNSANLILSSDISGKIIIHDWNDELVVELSKPFGKKVELGLEEGEYRIANIIEADVYELEIVLVEGDSFVLNAKELMKTDVRDIKRVEDTSGPLKRDSLLGNSFETHFYGGPVMKSTRIYGEYAVLLGGTIGLTFNRNFSVGLAAYARAVHGEGALELDVDMDPGKPGYGGLTFAYSFAPSRKIHFEVGALLGSGNYWYRNFYIFEPEIRVVLNLSRIVRVGFGLSMPITDKDDVGLENPLFGINLRFGK